jgi:hypothetical protein
MEKTYYVYIAIKFLTLSIILSKTVIVTLECRRRKPIDSGDVMCFL